MDKRQLQDILSGPFELSEWQNLLTQKLQFLKQICLKYLQTNMENLWRN